MSNVGARRLVLSAAVLFASLGLTSVSHAASLTATFLGNVQTSDLPAQFPADAFTKFTVTYDSGLTVTNGTPGLIAIYGSPASVWNIQVGSYVTSGVGGQFSVSNNFLGGDTFVGQLVAPETGTFAPGSDVGGVPLFAAVFSVKDTSASMFSDFSLPTATFTGFDQAFLMLDFFVLGGAFNTDLQVRANIFSFTIEPTVSAETPLPAALPLFAAGLGVIGFVVRRRRKAPGKLAAA
jgi:hypothetical protein